MNFDQKPYENIVIFVFSRFSEPCPPFSGLRHKEVGSPYRDSVYEHSMLLYGFVTIRIVIYSINNNTNSNTNTNTNTKTKTNTNTNTNTNPTSLLCCRPEKGGHGSENLKKTKITMFSYGF